MTPRLSVVIPTHRRGPILVGTLTALAQEDVPADSFEVIVVADGEDEDSLAEARTLHLPFRLSLLQQPRTGAASARNRGAREARAPIVLFLDDDMRARPGLIAEHLRRHADPSIDVVLGHFAQTSEGLSEPFFAAYVRAWWARRFAQLAQADHRFTYDDVFSGHFSIKRDLFHKVGGFQEGFTHGHSGEDYELAVRLLSAGAGLAFAPRAATMHMDDPTVERALRRSFADGRGHAIIAREHPDMLIRLPLARALFGHGRALVKQAGMPRTPKLSFVVASAFKLRRFWQWSFGRAHLRAYWSGVLTELGSPAELRRLFQEAELTPTEPAHASFDVLMGYQGLVELLATDQVRSLNVWVGERPICRLSHHAGAEPLRPLHVVESLCRDHSWSIVRALSSLGWTLDGKRSFHRTEQTSGGLTATGVELVP